MVAVEWVRADGSGLPLSEATEAWQDYNSQLANPSADDATVSQQLVDADMAFDVAWVLERVGDQYFAGQPAGALHGNTTVECFNIDDECFGCVIDQEKTLAQWYAQHAGPYNFQILDGNPIRLLRRPVNSDLIIDGEILQADCIPQQEGGPAIVFSRYDPSALPRQIEIDHLDPERDLSRTVQVARYPGAPLNVTSVSATIDFVISPEQATEIANEWLYRIWASQLQAEFQVRPEGLVYEPGDVIDLISGTRTHTILVRDSIITIARTNIIKGTILLSRNGFSGLAGGRSSAESVVPTPIDDAASWLVVV